MADHIQSRWNIVAANLRKQLPDFEEEAPGYFSIFMAGVTATFEIIDSIPASEFPALSSEHQELMNGLKLHAFDVMGLRKT